TGRPGRRLAAEKRLHWSSRSVSLRIASAPGQLRRPHEQPIVFPEAPAAVNASRCSRPKDRPITQLLSLPPTPTTELSWRDRQWGLDMRATRGEHAFQSNCRVFRLAAQLGTEKRRMPGPSGRATLF